MTLTPTPTCDAGTRPSGVVADTRPGVLHGCTAHPRRADRGVGEEVHVCLGFGHIVASEIEVTNMLVNLV
jgi:hypothetical protein